MAYRVFLKLLCHFGPQRWWPRLWRAGAHRDEIIVGAVLTQGTRWRNVEGALRELERAGLTSLEAIASADEATLRRALGPVPYKSRKIRTLREANALLSDGHIPTREELLGIFGVGEETADVILLYGYGIPVFVLDGYTRRWAERFFGTKVSDDELRRRLHVEDDLFYLREMHALLDELGKRYCGRRPRCDVCPLSGECARSLRSAE
ncbi:MAG: endonuclease [Thermotogae bacterium]|nr:endonuclease [Thermotogota bacterium]